MKEQLYQLHVEDRKGRLLAVGPKAGRQFCEALCMTVNRLIIDGKEREWSNPHVVRAA